MKSAQAMKSRLIDDRRAGRPPRGAHAREALCRETAFLSSILGGVGDALIVGDGCGHVLWANAAAQQWFGIESVPLSADGAGLDRLTTDPPTRLACLEEALRGAATGLQEVLLEGLPEDQGGRPVWLSVNAQPRRTPGGETVGVVVVCRDISLAKEAQQACQDATRRAEEANRAKTDFLSTMSHEIRTPMNSILAMADLLSDTALSSQQKEYVGIFQRTGGDLLTLVDQVLDLSKVEAGHLELEVIEFDLEVLIRHKIDVMRARAQIRGIGLDFEIKPAVPNGLVGDPGRIGQVIFNLLGNALKFTHKGKISVVVDCLSRLDKQVQIGFSVIDTGIGIPAEKLDLIFAPFTQADASTTRHYGGTGLGLTITRALVELMGGRIEVESEVGVGSRFFFTIPLTVSDNAHQVEEPTASVTFTAALASLGRRGVRILLAEDSADNIYIIRAYLRQPGVQLDVVQNGQEALDAFKRGRYDVVLMDMEMPVMDGYAATRSIRQWESEHQRASTPLLALTAYALKSEVQKAIAAGCTAHLTKPIKRPVLIDAIYQQTLQVRRDPAALQTSATAQESLDSVVEDEIGALRPAYLQGIRANTELILEALAADNYTPARALGHQMAGSGGAYGFPEISRLGKQLETAGAGKNAEAVQRQVKALSSFVEAHEVYPAVAG